MSSKFLNANTDNTLGGENSSNSAVPSQKAVKEYVDAELNTKQDTLTAGSNITINNNTISATVPTVNDNTITITQGGTTKGSFTLNQNNDATIALDAGGGGALADLTDVTITTPANNQGLIYNSTSQEWENGNISAEVAGTTLQFTGPYTTESSANKDLSNLTSTGNAKIVPSQTGQSGKFLTTDGTSTSWAEVQSVPSVDEATISISQADKLQAIGLIDQNSGVFKAWTGTKAQYDAIVTKDSHTLYNITDEVSSVSQNNLADTSLSNLTSTGEAHFVNPSMSNLNNTGKLLFNSDVTWQYTSLADGVALTTSDVTYSLSSYLPNDNHTYAVLFRFSRTTSSSTGYYSSTISIPGYSGYFRFTNSNGISGLWTADHIWLPINTTRTITYKYISWLNQGGDYGIACYGYYRVGDIPS